MALLWAEGFDHYGTNIAVMASNGYSAAAGILGTAAGARTGTGFFRGQNGQRAYARRSLNGPKTIIGQGCAFKLASAPGNEGWDNFGIKFGLNTGNDIDNIILAVQATAGLGLQVRHYDTLKGRSENNLLAIGAWNWVEARLERLANRNWICEVRLNGVTVLVVNGMDITQDAMDSVTLGNRAGAATGKYDVEFDDWVVWDTTGTVNNNFMGDHRCVTTYPNSDDVLQQWTPSSGTSGFTLIDEVPPNDLGYIEAQTAGAISEFGKSPVNIYTNSVAGVMLVSRAMKTDAGVSTYRSGITSNGVTVNSPVHTLGTSFAYSQHVFERDPNGNQQWTLNSFNNAKLRLTRVD